MRLYRKNPEILSLDQWSDRLIDLLEERDMGVLTGRVLPRSFDCFKLDPQRWNSFFKK